MHIYDLNAVTIQDVKRNGKAKNQSALLSVLLRQDIKDVLMDFKGCCIFLPNIPSSGAHKKNIESICSFIRACKTRPRMCCWRK